MNLSSPHLSATILLNCSKQTNRQYFKLYLHCYECSNQAKMLLIYKLLKDQTESHEARIGHKLYFHKENMKPAHKLC